MDYSHLRGEVREVRKQLCEYAVHLVWIDEHIQNRAPVMVWANEGRSIFSLQHIEIHDGIHKKLKYVWP